MNVAMIALSGLICAQINIYAGNNEKLRKIEIVNEIWFLTKLLHKKDAFGYNVTSIVDENANFEFVGEVKPAKHVYSALSYVPEGLEGYVVIPNQEYEPNLVEKMKLPNDLNLIDLSNFRVGKQKESGEWYFFQSEEGFSYLQMEFLLPNSKQFSGSSSSGIKRKILYYELEVVQFSRRFEETCIGVGLAPLSYRQESSFVGWRNSSIAIHSDNGAIYDNFVSLKDEDAAEYTCKLFTQGSTVGIGWNVDTGEVFFTLDGEIMQKKAKTARNPDDETLFPTVTTNCDDDIKIVFKVNTGRNTVKRPFKFRAMNVWTDYEKCERIGFCDVVIKNV